MRPLSSMAEPPAHNRTDMVRFHEGPPPEGGIPSDFHLVSFHISYDHSQVRVTQDLLPLRLSAILMSLAPSNNTTSYKPPAWPCAAFLFW